MEQRKRYAIFVGAFHCAHSRRRPSMFLRSGPDSASGAPLCLLRIGLTLREELAATATQHTGAWVKRVKEVRQIESHTLASSGSRINFMLRTRRAGARCARTSRAHYPRRGTLHARATGADGGTAGKGGRGGGVGTGDAGERAPSPPPAGGGGLWGSGGQDPPPPGISSHRRRTDS